MQAGHLRGLRILPSPPRCRKAVALAVIVFLLAGARVWAQGVDFPGPAIVNLDTTTVCCIQATGFAGADRYLVVGTADGFLDLAQFRVQTGTIGVLTRFFAGGLAQDFAQDPAPSATGRIVAAMANPDRLDFLTVQPAGSFFTVEESVDLPEDPGRVRSVDLGTAAEPGLVVSLPGMDRVVVLDHGPGGWAIRQEIPVGDGPETIGVGDLDGDGLPEIYLSQRGYLSGNVAVLVQDGTGSFHLDSTLDPGFIAGPLAVFDIDGTGPPELLVGAAEQPAVHVFSLVSGSYIEQPTVGLALPVDILKPGRLLDGRTALITGSTGRGVVEMQVREGGAWSRAGAFYAGCRPVDFLVHDLSGDGRFDVTCVGDAPGISILYGDQERVFWSFPVSVLDGTPLGLTLADVDGGGRPSAVVAFSQSSRVDIIPNPSDGVFPVLPTGVDLGILPDQVSALGEIAPGGEPVVVGDPLNDRLLIFDLALAGTANLLDTIVTGAGLRNYRVADVDGDGHSDLVFLRSGQAEVGLAFGLGGGVFDAPVSFPLEAVPVAVACLDLDGDGNRELAFVDGVSRTWYIQNTGGRTFGATTLLQVGSKPRLLAVGDFDGDLDDDLVAASNGARTLTIFQNDGAGHLLAQVTGYDLDGAASALVTGDVNDDGRADILANLRELGILSVVVPGEGISGASTLNFAVAPDCAAVAQGFFNGDGLGDVLALEGDLQLGMTLLNGSRTLVPVFPQALEISCLATGPSVTVIPDRARPWSLAGSYVRDGSVVWLELAGPGWAEEGTITYDRGRWLWDPAPGFPASDVARIPADPFRLRLTMGVGAEAETLDEPWGDPCGKTVPQTAFPVLDWSGRPRPNPFNPVLQFSIDVKRPGPVTVGVYDLRGRLVREIYSGPTPVGRLDLAWHGETDHGMAPSGVYIIHGAAEGARVSAKVVLAR